MKHLVILAVIITVVVASSTPPASKPKIPRKDRKPPPLPPRRPPAKEKSEEGLTRPTEAQDGSQSNRASISSPPQSSIGQNDEQTLANSQLNPQDPYVSGSPTSKGFEPTVSELTNEPGTIDDTGSRAESIANNFGKLFAHELVHYRRQISQPAVQLLIDNYKLQDEDIRCEENNELHDIGATTIATHIQENPHKMELKTLSAIASGLKHPFPERFFGV